MRGRAPVKFPAFLPASFFKSETAAYVISQALDEELQKARPSELRLVSLDIASHKKAELFYRVYVFSFILCWREIAFGILWPFWDVGVLLRSKWLGSWLFPTIVEQGVGCIFLCGGSEAGMHFEITHADNNALWEFIKVEMLISCIIRFIGCSEVPFFILFICVLFTFNVY